MPNFEFSDTSSFRSDNTLSMNDFKRGGGKSVSGIWKIVCWVLIVAIVIVGGGLGYIVWSRGAEIKRLSSATTVDHVKNLKEAVDKIANDADVPQNKGDLKKWIEENKEGPKSS